jgi:hypothetical protein
VKIILKVLSQIPLNPKKCCGKKIRFPPMKKRMKCNLPVNSHTGLPVILGNHRYVAINIPKTAPKERTKWKCLYQYGYYVTI